MIARFAWVGMGFAYLKGMSKNTNKQKYNHAFTIAFVVISEDAKGEDVTNEMFYSALRQRLKDLEQNDGYNEVQEACQPPYDTYKVED